MPFDYTSVRDTADELLEEFGMAATIRRLANTGDPYDPTQTATDTACTVVVTDYAHSEKDGTRIQVKDRKVLVAAGSLAITPTPADRFVLGGISYEIVAVSPLEPGGTVVMYEMQVRF
jgi:hypothetical protein